MAGMGEKVFSQEEILIQKHKQEKKALQADILQLKHSFTKGDKKKKKEATEQISKLEEDLRTRHDQELAELTQGAGSQGDGACRVSGVNAGLERLTVQDGEVAEQQPVPRAKKTSKAQKRREKKAAQSSERESEIQAQEVVNLTSSRHLEAVRIKVLLAQRGLQIHEIPSDGNCLYVAICHQLHQRNVESSNESLRHQVSECMKHNHDDFLPFLTKDDGDLYSPDDFEEYCDQIANTPAWGGQLEIRALCNVLKTPIEVIQSEGPPIVSGDEYGEKPLILTYYRHAYGLGEHYHSVEDKVDDDDDEFT